MRRKAVLPASACAVLLLGVAFSSGRGDSPRPAPSPHRRVTIDGSTFAPGVPGPDDDSPERHEFERFRGNLLPESFPPPGNRQGHPAFPGRLAGVETDPSGATPALPRGLTAEHTLRFDSPTGSIDLVLGKMQGVADPIRNRLAADGWELHAHLGPPGVPWVMEKRTGKEKTVVWLDEAENSFLLFRETGR